MASQIKNLALRPLLQAQARKLAWKAHTGQYDKAGHPYFEHVERVAMAVRDNYVAMIVAWLHDVGEDHPQFWPEIEATFPAEIVRLVRLLDRTGKANAEYYAAIKTDEVALRVKLADIADNASEHRLAQLPPDVAARLRAKYARAHELLTG